MRSVVDCCFVQGNAPGEVTGLKLDAVDWQRGGNGIIEVRTQVQPDLDRRLVVTELKVESAVRTLMMPAVCAAALRAHVTRQQSGHMPGRIMVWSSVPRAGGWVTWAVDHWSEKLVWEVGES